MLFFFFFHISFLIVCVSSGPGHITGVSDLGGPSSNFDVFVSSEVIKWKQNGCYKGDLLHFNKSV